MKSIAAIVLNWKTPKLTLDTVDSLLKVTHTNFKFHIFIVDNGSTDDSVSQFKAHYRQNKNVTLIENSQNLGYAEGNNRGIAIAIQQKFDYLLIINSDVKVKPDFLEIMYKFLKSNPEYAMVGPKIYFAPGYEYHSDRYTPKDLGKVIWSVGGQIDWQNIYGSNIGIDEVDQGQFESINSDIDYISGCCQLIRTSVVKKHGSYDKKYFMYLEDSDYSLRLKKLGYKIACIPKSIIWHFNSGSSGGGPLHDYFLTRNRLLFGFRYASIKTKLALFKDSLRLFFTSPYSWQRQGVVDYYLNKLGKGSWK